MEKSLVRFLAAGFVALFLVPAPSWAGEGCLHNDISACLARLAPMMTKYSLDNINNEINKVLNEVDINGERTHKANRVAATLQFTHPIVPNYFDHRLAIIRFDDNKIITRLDIDLDHSVGFAKTAEDYANSGIALAVDIALGSDCANISDPSNLYRLVHKLKSQVKLKEKREVNTFSARDSIFGNSEKVELCGALMSYSTSSGTDTNDITVNNPHGVFLSVSLVFEPLHSATPKATPAATKKKGRNN
jgi:hypothetical protein